MQFLINLVLFEMCQSDSLGDLCTAENRYIIGRRNVAFPQTALIVPKMDPSFPGETSFKDGGRNVSMLL